MIEMIAGCPADGMLTMDEYDDCIVGVVEQFGRPPIVCYDKDKIVARLMGDGMSEEEAVEFYEYNQLGAGMGENTPCFLTKGDVVYASEAPKMGVVNWKPMHKNVIAVAVRRLDGWCAYIGPVPGVRHTDEYAAVAETGVKLPVDVARAIFPEMTPEVYAK